MEEAASTINTEEMSYYVTLYLYKDKREKGRYFHLRIEDGENKSIPGYGLSFFNELLIDAEDISRGPGYVSEWKEVYTTGMIRYRAGHPDSLDNWKDCFGSPSIIEEECSKRMVMGYEANGVVTIARYDLEKNQLEIIERFDISAHIKKLKKRMR